jgi:hypothetical protein
LLTLLGELDRESKIALEATHGWEWLTELLEDHGYELHLAHPVRTKAIASARVKIDAVDAALSRICCGRSVAGGPTRSSPHSLGYADLATCFCVPPEQVGRGESRFDLPRAPGWWTTR